MSELLGSVVESWEREEFFESYIVTGLGSSNDNATPQGGSPLDKKYRRVDISWEAMDDMRSDCNRFIAENREWIGHFQNDDEFERAGNDFWLTRNGDGGGFWDGDWPEPAATKLTDAAHAFGPYTLYVGDDGKIHGMKG